MQISGIWKCIKYRLSFPDKIVNKFCIVVINPALYPYIYCSVVGLVSDASGEQGGSGLSEEEFNELLNSKK